MSRSWCSAETWGRVAVIGDLLGTRPASQRGTGVTRPKIDVVRVSHWRTSLLRLIRRRAPSARKNRATGRYTAWASFMNGARMTSSMATATWNRKTQ